MKSFTSLTHLVVFYYSRCSGFYVISLEKVNNVSPDVLIIYQFDSTAAVCIRKRIDDGFKPSDSPVFSLCVAGWERLFSV